jgi:hypothetical protein
LKEQGKKSINISLWLWSQLTKDKAETGKSLADSMEDAYRQSKALTQPVPIAAQPSKKFERLAPTLTLEQRERAEWHKLLDIILDHGDEDDVTGIQRNLIWGSRDVKKRRPKTGNG